MFAPPFAGSFKEAPGPMENSMGLVVSYEGCSLVPDTGRERGPQITLVYLANENSTSKS